MSPGLKLFLNIVLILAVIDLIAVSIRLFPLLKRIREIKYIKKDRDVISAEAEVVDIKEERIDDMTTQYTVKLHYEVGYRKVYKDFILINKQSVRVGQKFTVLCDSSDPEKSVIQDYTGLSGEGYQLKSLIFNFVIIMIVIAADALSQAFSYISGNP